MAARISIVLVFLALLVAPFLFRPERAAAPTGARRLIIITPHNEQIRYEFSRAFDAWHRERFGEPVDVIFNAPGGTSEIRKMLFAQYEAAIEQGRIPGGSADLVFGGGSYEHEQLKRGVVVQGKQEPITEPVGFDSAWLEARYGSNEIGGAPLYDPDGYWFGNALSGFGIVYNRDVLSQLGVDEPGTWADLCDPRLRGWVALVNPGQSGSVTTAFEAILHREGWARGWRILRRAAANARYFSGSSLKPPTDVSQGDAAMGVCIDFYGRFQAQAIREGTGRDRLGYVVPPRVSVIDPDPISMLRGAPDRELARRFIEFVLTDEAQALWQLPRAGDDGAALGPLQYELRRLPVKRSFYVAYGDRMIDRVNPFDDATAAPNADRAVRSFITPLFSAMAMDSHHALREAWARIVAHPAYPGHGGVVIAADIDDPELREMLEAFDAMPEIEGPDGVRYPLDTTAHLAEVKSGWLRNGWADAAIWPKEAPPADVMRRRCAAWFTSQYESIVRVKE